MSNIYLKISDQELPVIEILSQQLHFYRRERLSYVIILKDSFYNKIKELTPLSQKINWSIRYEYDSYQKSDGSFETPLPEVYNYSEYYLPGPIIDNRDGTISILMEKPTELEKLQHQLNEALSLSETNKAYQKGVNDL